MSEINASNFKKEHGDLAPDLVGVTELTSPYFFVPPSGDTASRPSDCEPGTLRFNTDIGTLEVFRGKTLGWEQIQRRESQYLGGGTGSNTGTGTRGLLTGGFGSPDTSMEEISFLTISTLGNTQDFGDLIDGRQGAFQSMCNHTRAIHVGGSQVPANTDRISRIEVATTGNAVDYGDMTSNRSNGGGVNNQIRAITGGGTTPGICNIIEMINMLQASNGVDFGDMSYQAEKQAGGVNSSTRGLFFGGNPNDGSAWYNNIEFITMSTTGNSQDFGDLSATAGDGHGAGSATRGVIQLGYINPSDATNTLEFVTIATTGNTVDFGDLTQKRWSSGVMSSKTRMVIAGGWDYPTSYNIIDFVEIATTGNAVDFGDLNHGDASNGAVNNVSGFSNGHGGI